MIKLNSKDKSLILLVLSAVVILWFLFSMISRMFFSQAFATSEAMKILTSYQNQDSRWLNLSRPLKEEDLKDRVILLDFWTYACVNCLHVIPEIKKIEEEFGNKVVVIGVHSGKFENEKDFESIKKAVLKYDLHHAIVNDSELKIWNAFKINAWPSLVLFDANGNVKKVYVGENEAKRAFKDVKKMVGKYRYQINREAFPILLEKNKVAKTVLNYATKIIYVKDFVYKSKKESVLIVANSGSNQILINNLSGEILFEIGSQKSGLIDGKIDEAMFKAPSGLLYKNQKLYVADTGNHALREIDFKENKVATLIGDGSRGEILTKEIEVEDSGDAQLASPTDLEFYPDSNHIAIANSGTHQILNYNIENKKLKILAGSGIEGIDDGKYPHNSLAQTSDLSVFAGNLYFLDSETSSLRMLDKSGNIKTLIGKGLFDFGDKNGDEKNALMQHPLGLYVDNSAAYISDSFNHKIKKYDFTSRKISEFLGSTKGDNLGSKTQFYEPDGIAFSADYIYVSDTNNNRIIAFSKKKKRSTLLNIMPPLQLPQEGFLQYLPNLQKADLIKIKPQKSAIKIDFQEEWKLNEAGPSFINLLELLEEKKANLIATYDWNMIKNGDLDFPKLAKDKKYLLQGTLYYCENKPNALCYIKSYEQEIEVDDNGLSSIIIEILGH